MSSTVGGRVFAVRRTGLETKSSCVDPHNVPDTGMLDYQQVNEMERLGRVSCAEMTRYTVWTETGNSADYADRPNCCQVDAFGALEGGR